LQAANAQLELASAEAADLASARMERADLQLRELELQVATARRETQGVTAECQALRTRVQVLDGFIFYLHFFTLILFCPHGLLATYSPLIPV
jgi:hypothetical protein